MKGRKAQGRKAQRSYTCKKLTKASVPLSQKLEFELVQRRFVEKHKMSVAQDLRDILAGHDLFMTEDTAGQRAVISRRLIDN